MEPSPENIRLLSPSFVPYVSLTTVRSARVQCKSADWHWPEEDEDEEEGNIEFHFQN